MQFTRQSKLLRYLSIVPILGALLFLVRYKYVPKDDHIAVNVEVDTIEIVIPQEIYAFGIRIDSFNVTEKKIDRNEFLADILLKHNVNYQVIDRIAKISKDVFDVKRLRAGKKYMLLCSKDSAHTAQYFIYIPNPADYVIYKLFDTLLVSAGQKEIEVLTREATGIIQNSLYQCMIDNKLSPVLALELSEVYAWQIDFFHIQKGDKFKVIYKEKFVEDVSIGIGRIQAVLFTHRGTDFYGIYFDQDSLGDYYDEEGNSLRKAFLKAPLQYSRISSRYSKRRYHPVLKRYKSHLGTDYAAPRGTPIRSVGDGVISEAMFKKYNGNYVKVKHNSTYSTQYLHMSKIAKGITPGKVVRQGDVIGYVGSTGLATGPHVCFRFWKDGEQVNPYRIKIPPSKPVKPELREAFDVIKNEMMRALNNIDINKQGDHLSMK